jgi:hypothetical protein
VDGSRLQETPCGTVNDISAWRSIRLPLSFRPLVRYGPPASSTNITWIKWALPWKGRRTGFWQAADRVKSNHHLPFRWRISMVDLPREPVSRPLRQHRQMVRRQRNCGARTTSLAPPARLWVAERLRVIAALRQTNWVIGGCNGAARSMRACVNSSFNRRSRQRPRRWRSPRRR